MPVARQRAAPAGICAYATSRTSTWRKANSISPATDGAPHPAHEILPLQRVQQLARPRAARTLVRARPRAPSQNTVPTIAAFCRSCFSVSGERVQAGRDDALDRLGQRQVVGAAALGEHAQVLLGVQGVAVGLGQRAQSRRPAGMPRRRAGRRSAPRSPSSESGVSEIVVALRLPPPHPGRRSSSSGRVAHTTSSGTPSAQSTRCSMKSSRTSSAQWRSSNASTKGRCSARPSK